MYHFLKDVKSKYEALFQRLKIISLTGHALPISKRQNSYPFDITHKERVA